MITPEYGPLVPIYNGRLQGVTGQKPSGNEFTGKSFVSKVQFDSYD